MIWIGPTCDLYISEGQDAQDDDRRPAETIGEDNEEETHCEFPVAQGEWSVGPSPSDATKHPSVRHQDHNHSGEGETKS